MKANTYKKDTQNKKVEGKYIAKKFLGQNFLRSESALRKIISAGEIQKKDTILEIGPGQGALTEKLLETGATVFAVEKDGELFSFLQEKFSSEIKSNQLILLEGDILKLSLKQIGIQKPYKLIANIPYYITGEIFRSFLEEREDQPDTIIVLIQKEVAERIVAHDHKESILSLSVKVYGKPVCEQKVPRGAFTPSPSVDSAILSIKNISKKYFKNRNEEERFFMLIRAGFAHKRKKVVQNIKKLFSSSDIPNLFKKMSLKEDSRAEDMRLEDWLEVLKNLQNIKQP